MKRNFLKACAFLCVFYLLSTPNSISFPHSKGFRVNQSTPDIFLFAVYYDVQNPLSLEKLQKTLDQGSQEFEAETGYRILFTKPQPMRVSPWSSLDEIRLRSDMRNSIIKWDGHLFVSNRTEISTEVKVMQLIDFFGGWKRNADNSTRFYGLTRKDIRTIAMFDFNLQANLSNAGLKNVATCTLKHEILHYFGVDHNNSEDSIMFWNADKSHGKFLAEDQTALQTQRMLR
ncbi:MAG: hypothetical protein IT410_04270 [Candidatus Doudnabacteria bacterium]|nr:hypothetical protein [Candidatus Doudnabacteria bacterium]